MARTSLAAAKAELYAAFGGNTSTIANVVVILDYEPPRDELPAAVTITIQTMGVTPDYFRFAVRIYVKATGVSKVTQDLMDSILMDVDRAVSSGFGESEWRIRALDAEGLLMAENNYECGRDDL